MLGAIVPDLDEDSRDEDSLDGKLAQTGSKVASHDPTMTGTIVDDIDDSEGDAIITTFGGGNGGNAQIDLNHEAFREVDWRSYMSGVKSQSPCGSCWAFAAASVSEGVFGIRNRISPTPRVSEQELLDCVENNGCEGGGAPSRALQWGKDHGYIPHDDYPYTAVKSDSCQSPDNRKRIMKVKGRTFFKYPTALTIASEL